jgi:hypothetical protein
MLKVQKSLGHGDKSAYTREGTEEHIIPGLLRALTRLHDSCTVHHGKIAFRG